MRDAIERQHRERRFALVFFLVLVILAGATETRRVVADLARTSEVAAPVAVPGAVDR